MSIRTCPKCGQQFIGGHRCPAEVQWEARRWCKGDDAWTNWQSCTAEQKARWEAGGDFQFRAARARGEGQS